MKRTIATLIKVNRLVHELNEIGRKIVVLVAADGDEDGADDAVVVVVVDYVGDAD